MGYSPVDGGVCRRNNRCGLTRAARTQGVNEMKIRTRALGALAGLLSLFALTGIAGAVDRPYTEGNVVEVSSIRTENGQFENYMAWLAGPYKQFMDAQKAAGLIVGYNVYATSPRGTDEPDLYLVTVYKNMAALDDLTAKSDAMAEKIFGAMPKASADTVERGKLRTVIGSELMRELKLK
jgi:hypothetical protein